MELKIINKKPLILKEVSENIASKKNTIAVQQKVFDFTNKFSKFNKEVSHKLIDELIELRIPRVEEHQLIQIINLAPKTETEIKTIFAGTKTTVTTESIKKILEILKKHEK